MDDFKAAVLAGIGERLNIETGRLAHLAPTDVLVKVEAAGLCHTDLEAIEGALKVPFPVVLGHEAAGTIVEIGSAVATRRKGDRVVLSWNPHCGHCFYCDQALPILCEQFLANGPQAVHFDGNVRIRSDDGEPLRQLMYLGAFAEYCVVDQGQAIPISSDMPLDRACLIGCAVMTGVGAACNVATICSGATVMVIGCGAVGLSAVQGARLAGASTIIAVDRDPAKLDLAEPLGATHRVDVNEECGVDVARRLTNGRGADSVIEAAGTSPAFRLSVEAVRPGGEVIWLGKLHVDAEQTFRWGALMHEKRIRRSSYGGARPERDFPLLAKAYLDGSLMLDELITRRIPLDEVNQGFDALRAGSAIRSVVMGGA